MSVRIEPTSVLTIAPGFQQGDEGAGAAGAGNTLQVLRRLRNRRGQRFRVAHRSDSHLQDLQPNSIVSII
jgi:hypothetical protein